MLFVVAFAALTPVTSSTATLPTARDYALMPGAPDHTSQPPDLEKRASGTDQPDAAQGEQTHAIYFVPRDAADNELEGSIGAAIDSIRAWFARETSSAGRAAIRPRFDRLQGGGWDITYVNGDADGSAYGDISDIADELIAKGFNVATKRYLVYAETRASPVAGGGSLCGESYYAWPGMTLPRYAVVYLGANEGCGARDFGSGTAAGAGRSDAIAAHEWLHLEGAMPMVSRHYCPTSLYHVCTVALWAVPPVNDPVALGRIDPESVDIMFPLIHAPLREQVLDRNRDDYLDHDLPLYDLRLSRWME